MTIHDLNTGGCLLLGFYACQPVAAKYSQVFEVHHAAMDGGCVADEGAVGHRGIAFVVGYPAAILKLSILD